ncbi:LysR family transcriptional regulator [Bacillus sp. 1P02SD]|uniref:LysR family transcriptional regulator n=1 Tax=Bacillus sp. 1P02SD TaxID=3132264 RepID=UPI0039A01A4E
MDSKDWTILKILYEEKNITRAAEKVYISQPALTYRIKSIEQELGVKIMFRTKKGIKFTKEGEFLIQYANNMLYNFQKVKDHLLNMNDTDGGMIRIGVSRNFARYMLPDILKDFLDENANVQFHVTTDLSQSILKMLEKDTINLAIVRGDNYWKEGKILLKRESLCIISREQINIEKLHELPRINFKTENDLQQTIERWWQQNYVKPCTVAMDIDNIETCIKMVTKGLGYAIVPSIGLTEYPELHKIVLTDEDEEVIVRDTWLLYRLEDLEYPMIKKFISFIKNKNYG